MMYLRRDRRARIAVLLFVSIAGLAGLTAQDGAERKPGSSSFTFRQGQTVYITAFHTIEHAPSRGLTVIPPLSIVDNHLPAELQVRKDFEKRKVYKPVGKASGADFVFVVLIHDNAAEGLALPPAAFIDYQKKLNIEALREAAYARSTAGPLKMHNLGRISDRLVKNFHDEQARPARPNP